MPSKRPVSALIGTLGSGRVSSSEFIADIGYARWISARYAGVGTVAFTRREADSRYPSYAPKMNTLSRMIRLPADPPNWLKTDRGLGMDLPLASYAATNGFRALST